MSNLLFHNFDKSNDDVEDFNSTATNIISTRDNGLINDGNGSETDTINQYNEQELLNQLQDEQYTSDHPIEQAVHSYATHTPTKTQNNIMNMHVLTVESIILIL